MPLPAQTTLLEGMRKQDRPNSFVSTKAMLWHDAIIDDMFANPGTTIKATAERLGRSPVTVGYVVGSDLFKARYAQRRDQFNEDLDTRLIGKLSQVAELSLDLTLEQLQKKRTAVPLPLLHDITTKSLDKLGYGPKPAAGPSVVVNNNNGGQQLVAAPVSASALEEARASLRQVEQSRTVALATLQELPPNEREDCGRLAAPAATLTLEHEDPQREESRSGGGGPSEDLL